MMVDKTGVGPSSSPQAAQSPPSSSGDGAGVSESQSESGGQSLATSREEDGEDEIGREEDEEDSKRDSIASSDKSPGHSSPQLASNSSSKPVGRQKWRNVRAVMAYYTRLRKIKRTKSNQRWMKLRTTVQLSGAITSTIQKTKPPLKREDSFLKRFSTRQIPETQETVDTGDDGDSGTSQSVTNTRRRRRRRQQRLPISVVNPDENFYFYWLLVLSCCVLYNLWTLIVRQSFPELQTKASVFWFSCDGFSDAMFLLDVAVQFRTGYLEQGLMVYDSKKLAGHYMKSRAFLLDLGALLPLDLLQFNIGVNPILRFPRFLKVYRLYHYYYMVESRTVYPNLWRVVNLIHILLILAHWFGCFYFLLSQAEDFKGEWVYPKRPGDYATLTRMYLGSLYWSTLTLTTIGDLPTPETDADYPSTDSPHPRRLHKSRILQFKTNSGYVFTIVSYLIGVFIFATIVGQVGNVITNRNANRLEFERLLDGAKTYMRHHKVPGGMKRRVLRWYDYSWSRGRIQGGGDINTALGLLPDKLKTELALHVNLSVLKKVTIFQECQPEFLHDLVLKMKAYIFTPGDSICRKGEVAREMFIIADGILEVLSETGRVLTTMKAGDFFGEIGILNLDGLNKRTADVRSVGYSELFSLSREDVLAAMKDYPEAQEILQNLGRKRLMEARNVSRGRVGGHLEKGITTASPLIAGGEDSSAGKRIVEKLRSDVKGLKNVLRRSRRGPRMRDESLELQPLNPGSIDLGTHGDYGHSGKGMLRRMSRVRSDDTEEDAPESPCEKLGAGLPLLNRLRLLKEKQEREERGTPSPAFSPPSIKLEQPPEVIGAGLPLIQRLLMLKQKEAMQATAAQAAEVLATTITPIKELPISRESEESRSSSKEHSDEEGSRKPPPILNRLVSLKRKDSGTPDSKATSVSSEPHIETKPLFKDKLKQLGLVVQKDPKVPDDVKVVECKVEGVTKVAAVAPKGTLFKDKLKMLTSKEVKPPENIKKEIEEKEEPKVSTAKVPLLKDKLKLLTLKEPVVTSQVISLPAPLKKQESWSVLKKAAILKTPSHSTESPTCSASSRVALVKDSETTQRTSGVLSISATGSKRTCDISDSLPSKLTSETSSDHENTSITDKVNGAKLLRNDGTEEHQGGLSEVAQSVLDTNVDNQQSVNDRNPVFGEIEKVDNTNVGDRSVSDDDGEAGTSSSAQRKKPNMLSLQQGTKFYMSIDDLSPEYSGLPFVKKLKILNERQKLAELEREVAFVYMRSSSLDSGSGAAEDSDQSGLTRSHSEACAMEYVRTQQRTRDHRQQEQDKPPRPTHLPQPSSDESTAAAATLTSPESNETLERRHLKSILKKLSATSLFSTSSEEKPSESEATEPPQEAAVVAEVPVARPSPAEIRKLMRAPTIEGYAARHSKLTKSVTFNRDTLQSPPAMVTTPSIPADVTVHTKALFTLQDNTNTVEAVSPTSFAAVTTTDIAVAVTSSDAQSEHSINLALTTLPSAVISTTDTLVLSSETNTFPIPVSSNHVAPSEEEEEVNVQDTVVVSSATTVVFSTTTTTTPAVQSPGSPIKKKPAVLLLQRPQHPRIPNDKKFFRPSQLLLPTHDMAEEEYFGEVIVGIKQVIQGHLEEIQNKFQTQFQSLEMEVKRRDEIISQLQHRIQELEQPIQDGDDDEDIGDDGDISDMDDVSDQPFMRENSIDTVLTSPPPRLPEEDLEMLVSQRHPLIGSPQHQLSSMNRRSWEDHSEEETLELQDLPRSISPLSMWESDDNRDPNCGQTESCTVHLDSDSVAVNVGSDTDSSEEDDAFTCDEISNFRTHNRDWEVQMLAAELDRREGISRLEDEVAELTAAVSGSDLSRLSTSELDVLERALAAEDQRIQAAARAQSLDAGEDRHAAPSVRRRQRSVNGASGSVENLIQPKSLPRNTHLPGHSGQGNRNSVRRKLFNAKSLDEHSEMPKSTLSNVRPRNRSASSGNLPSTPPSSRSSFTAAGNLMRGIGHFVRNVSTSNQGSSSRRGSVAADPERGGVATISGNSQHTEDPPTLPPDL